jgi:hypothetical protein
MHPITGFVLVNSERLLGMSYPCTWLLYLAKDKACERPRQMERAYIQKRLFLGRQNHFIYTVLDLLISRKTGQKPDFIRILIANA